MMKSAKIPFLGFLLACSFTACKKPVTERENLEATKTQKIHIGEPVEFTMSQAAQGSTVSFSVTPANRVQINNSGNKASVLFGLNGRYTVTATANGLTSKRTVHVVDTAYEAIRGGTPPASTLALTAGDVIRIHVFRIDSGANSGLLFSAQTTNSYTCLGNRLLSETVSGTNSYSIKYTGVSVPQGCTSGTAKAGGFNKLYPIAAGVNSLSIEVNGTTYTGTIAKSGNNYTITWSDNTGVVMGPLQL